MSKAKSLKILAVLVLLFVSISFTDPTWTIVGIIGSIAVALCLSLKLDELLIVLLPFSFDVFVPRTVNLNASDFVLFPLLLFLALTRYKAISNNTLFKRASIWFLLFTTVIWVPLFTGFSAEQITSANLIAYIKLLIGFSYGLSGIWIFASSNFARRNELVKIWSLVAVAISASSLIAFLLNLVGINSQFMYSAYRLKGTFENPNTFALYLLVSLGIQIAVWINRPTRSGIFLSSVITAAIALANSRAGQISFVVMISILLLSTIFTRKNKKRIKSLYFLVLPIVYFGVIPGLITLFNFLKTFIKSSSEIKSSPLPEQNISTIQPTTGSNTINSVEPFSPSPQATSESINALVLSREPLNGDLRFQLWKAAIKLWEKSPINGVGIGNFPTESEPYTGVYYVAHNSFLSLLAETGLLGLACFLIPFLYLFYLLWNNRSNFIAKAMFATVVAMVIMMSANNLENVRFVWIVFGCTLAWANLKTDLLKSKLHEPRKP